MVETQDPSEGSESIPIDVELYDAMFDHVGDVLGLTYDSDETILDITQDFELIQSSSVNSLSLDCFLDWNVFKIDTMWGYDLQHKMCLIEYQKQWCPQSREFMEAVFQFVPGKIIHHTDLACYVEWESEWLSSEVVFPVRFDLFLNFFKQQNPDEDAMDPITYTKAMDEGGQIMMMCCGQRFASDTLIKDYTLRNLPNYMKQAKPMNCPYCRTCY